MWRPTKIRLVDRGVFAGPMIKTAHVLFDECIGLKSTVESEGATSVVFQLQRARYAQWWGRIAPDNSAELTCRYQ